MRSRAPKNLKPFTTQVTRSARDIVSCPNDNQFIQHAHPRVYLALKAKGKVKCPYCSSLFIYDPSAAD